jgi:hypothetical protein
VPLRHAGIEAGVGHADVREHAAAKLFLVVGVVADLLDRGRVAALAPDLSQEDILAIGRRHPGALYELGAAAAVDGRGRACQGQGCDDGGGARDGSEWMNIKSPSTVRRQSALPESEEPYRSRRVGSMEAVGVLPAKNTAEGRRPLEPLLLPSASSARHLDARRREQPKPWELFPIESAIIPLSAGALNPRSAGRKARTLRE